MKLENQVVSLELAKELKKLGYPQEGLWWWCFNNCYTKENKPEWTLISKKILSGSHYVAPTVAELGEKLKMYHYSCKFMPNYGEPKFKIIYYQNTGYTREIARELTEANARAKMLIYLIRNKLIKL